NAKYLPIYAVFGEKDGTSMRDNNINLTRYIARGYDTTVIEYQGRGHEAFNDEIQNLFDWMSRRTRDFYPKTFECTTMRRWDNYFWFVEIDELPPAAMLEPNEWDHTKRRGARM